jgi:hypothetical protein
VTFTQICRQTPDLVKIGQKFLALCIKIEARLLFLTAVRNIFQLNSGEEGTHSCVSIAKLNDCILLTATCRPAIEREDIVAYPWQQSLRERATVLYIGSLMCCISHNSELLIEGLGDHLAQQLAP